MSEFGFAYLKGEGCHIHPDDPIHGYWGDDDVVYLRQICGYINDHSLNLIHEIQRCRKPYLLSAAVEKGQFEAFGLTEGKA